MSGHAAALHHPVNRGELQWRALGGHRLGLLVKVAVHQWLARAEPGLRSVFTWNAQDNAHMIAINERLGYQISGRFRSWELAIASRPQP